MALANKADMCHRLEAAALAKAALTKEQHCRKSTERATALAESALAEEHCRRELAEHAAVLAESTLVTE